MFCGVFFWVDFLYFCLKFNCFRRKFDICNSSLLAKVNNTFLFSCFSVQKKLKEKFSFFLLPAWWKKYTTISFLSPELIPLLFAIYTLWLPSTTSDTCILKENKPPHKNNINKRETFCFLCRCFWCVIGVCCCFVF